MVEFHTEPALWDLLDSLTQQSMTAHQLADDTGRSISTMRRAVSRAHTLGYVRDINDRKPAVWAVTQLGRNAIGEPMANLRRVK